MPITGIPLPFVSYGGTAMLANFIAAGLLAERAHAPLQVSVRARPVAPLTRHVNVEPPGTGRLEDDVAVHRAGRHPGDREPEPHALMRAGVERLALLERREDRAASDLASMPGPSSITRITGDPSSMIARGSRTGRSSGENARAFSTSSSRIRQRGQAVQAGHGRASRAPRRGRGRCGRRPRERRPSTSAHSVSPASTAASNRWTSRARSFGADDQPFQELLARLLRRGAAGQRLRHAEDHRDRRAELVAQAGHELVAAGRALQERLLCDLELAGAAALTLEGLGQLLDDGRCQLRRDDARRPRPPRGRR